MLSLCCNQTEMNVPHRATHVTRSMVCVRTQLLDTPAHVNLASQGMGLHVMVSIRGQMEGE